MRWLFLLLTVACLATAYLTNTPSVLGIALLLAALFSFIAVLGFAQARIERVAQPQANMIANRDVSTLRNQAVLKKVAQTRARPPAQRPQSDDQHG